MKVVNDFYSFINDMDIQVKVLMEELQKRQHRLEASISFLKLWMHYSWQQLVLWVVIYS